MSSHRAVVGGWIDRELRAVVHVTVLGAGPAPWDPVRLLERDTDQRRVTATAVSYSRAWTGPGDWHSHKGTDISGINCFAQQKVSSMSQCLGWW